MASLRGAMSRLFRRPARGPARESLQADYRPQRNDRADPGEIVWAWVPFEEGDGRGKDRPVLVLSRAGDHVTGLMLTSKDHDRDAADEARWGRYWMDIGAGPWDKQGRPSDVRLDRLLDLSDSAVRREGAALDRKLFDAVVAEARRLHRRDLR
jgi:hypothetical protein